MKTLIVFHYNKCIFLPQSLYACGGITSWVFFTSPGLTTISLLQLVPNASSNVLAHSIISGRSQGLSRRLISVLLDDTGAR